MSNTSPYFQWDQLIILPPSNQYKPYSWIFQSCHMLYIHLCLSLSMFNRILGCRPFHSQTCFKHMYWNIHDNQFTHWLLSSTRVSHAPLSSSLPNYLFSKTTSPPQLQGILFFFFFYFLVLLCMDLSFVASSTSISSILVQHAQVNLVQNKL